MLALVLAGLGALGSGLLLGLFFTWSNAVLPGMDQSPPEAAVAVMTAANRAIQNPSFGLVFAGTPFVLVAGAIGAGLARVPSASLALGAAAAACLVGVIAVTAGASLPLNEALAAGTGEPHLAWAAFAVPWLRWNAVRIASCAVSAIGAMVGLCLLARAL